MANIRYNIPYTNIPNTNIREATSRDPKPVNYSLLNHNPKHQSFPGELIDNNPDKEIIYNLFINYYENPFFYKLKDVCQDITVNMPSHSMYVCKIASGTTIDKRYIICITPIDIYPIMHRIPMCDLKWESLQARTLQEISTTPLPPHSYRFKRQTPYNSLINRSIYEDGYTEYICDSLPLKVTMLHKKNDKFEYISVDKSMLNVALEQYSTVITFV